MRLGRSLSWMGLSQVISVLLQFAASVVLARMLTAQEMGVYAVAAATVGLLSLVQAFGLQGLIVRQEVLTDEISRTAFTVNALLGLLLALTTAAFSVIGGSLLNDARVRQVMLALSVSPLFGIFDFLPSAHLERAGRFKILALATISCSASAAVVTIMAALCGARYMTAAYAGWSSALLNVIIVNIAGRRHVSLRLGFTQWRGVGLFGLQMLATSGLHSIGGRLSDVFLGKIQGLGPLGIYGRASNLNNLLWSNIHMVIGRVMFVDFAQMHREGKPLRIRYIATVDIVTALLWPAFAGFAILSGPLIYTIYGQRWVPAALPMAILSLSSIVLVSMTMTWELFTATGNLSAQTRIEFFVALFSTAAFAAASLMGLAAAAASRVASALFAVIVYRPHVNRMTDTRPRDFLGIYVRSAVLTGIAVSPATILMVLTGFSPRTPILLVVGSTALGGCLWLLALVGTKHRLVAESRRALAAYLRPPAPSPEMVIADLRPYVVLESGAEH